MTCKISASGKVVWQSLTLHSDNPVEVEDDEPRVSATGKDNEIFADDPWNAMCVLGLRVYARGAVAKVGVTKGRNSM